MRTHDSSHSEAKRWRLKAVTLRGFRGVSGERTLTFDGQAALLHGNNGTGKSTFSMGLQWVLYGRMPVGVLQNKSPDKFLFSVASKDDGYSGEVILQRGQEDAVFRRDSETDEFTLKLNGRTSTGEEAETKRDELLGLDMDTFVRAVLLQQCRIRGLLLDEPKERNQAIDRLLGMEGLDVLGGLIKPKEFEKAAKAWREKIEKERREHDARCKLLKEQLDDAQNEARDAGFRNKDFNTEGLRLAVAALATALQDVAKAYEVEVEPLTDCASAKEANNASRLAAAGINAIRKNCELQKSAKEVRLKLAKLGEVNENWTDAAEQLTKANSALGAQTTKYGDSKAQAEHRTVLEARRQSAEDELKAANLLRKLLLDALEFLEKEALPECPVCERPLDDGRILVDSLKSRLKQMTSEAVALKDQALNTVKGELDNWDGVLSQTKDLERTVAQCQSRLSDRCQEVATALALTDVSDHKLQSCLDKAISDLEEKNRTIKDHLEAMEEVLAAVDGKALRIKDGLLPVLKKRAEIAELEERADRLKSVHEKDEANATKMARLAANLERIRQAILEAKGELADRILERAGPRAQQLYKVLARHPFFDTLTIRPTRQKNKVEYSFEVSATTRTRSQREARLVLSDGQMTAAAMALCFALAETADHGLDLLYVDDPTQNLDLPHKEAMAKTVCELARRKQIVVASQDEDFVNYLKSEGFHSCSVVHHFTEWDGQPKVMSYENGAKV